MAMSDSSYKRRARTGFGLAATALTLLAGCQQSGPKQQYYLLTTSTTLPYWQTAAAGFQKAAQQYGVTATMQGPERFDPQAEVDAFRAAVAKKPAGILISVANSSLLAPEIDAAISAGVPVITIDSDAPESKRLYFIGTNNLAAGRLGGQRAAAQLNGKGNVVLFSITNQPNLEERLKGYKDVLASYPGIKIVDVFDTKGDSAATMQKAADYLQRTGAGKVDGFLCLTSAAGRDVGEAIRRTGAQGRLVVAMDVDGATLQLVKEGLIDSTISQKPYTMALLGLQALEQFHHHTPGSNSTGGSNAQGGTSAPLGGDYGLDPFAPYPAFVDTGVSLVDKSNVQTVMDQSAKVGAQ